MKVFTFLQIKKENSRLKFKKGGFTLVELLVVITIVSIISAIVMVIINPIEINKRGRDAARFADFANISQAISLAAHDSTASKTEILCFNSSPICEGSTFPITSITRSINGAGWVKVNFKNAGLAIPILQIDPINTSTYNYNYSSDGIYWEINTTLESERYKNYMEKDGGNNPGKYELGTKLDLIS